MLRLAAAVLGLVVLPGAEAAVIETLVVAAAAGGGGQRFEGRIEAVKSATLAAQVAGRVVRIAAEAGQTVRNGQVLIQLDARELAGADAAQQAQLAQARAEWERQQRLHAQKFISRAALDQAELAYKAAQAYAGAKSASLSHASLNAPLNGVVGEKLVEVGDLATPGRPLLTVFDPSVLRVAVAVPASLGRELKLDQAKAWELEIGGQRLAIARGEWLPTVDSGSQTATLRLYLTGKTEGLRPGTAASVRIPLMGAERIAVPEGAIVRRGEVTGVYVMDGSGKPRLRQVRLGDALGGQVNIEAGLAPGERVALDPAKALAAARGK